MHSKTRSKKGAALIYVIVAVGVLIILGSTVTMSAYTNLKAAKIESESSNNFYSADSVMNAIVSGLEQDVSTAYSKAYNTVLAKLSDYADVQDATDEFKGIFYDEVKEILKDENKTDALSPIAYYSVERLTEYVQNVYEDNICYTISAVEGKNVFKYLGEDIIIANLHVTYEDDSGYYDEISTDIRITVPDIDLTSLANPADVIDAVLLADDGLCVEEETGLTVTGNAYLGDDTDEVAVTVGHDGVLTIMSPRETVAGGEIVLERRSKFSFLNGESTIYSSDLWTENLTVKESANLDLTGDIYVYDDLEINEPNATVTLTGKYIGYSSSDTDPAESSSININGGNTTLDMSNITDIVLAGSSYLSTSTVEEISDYADKCNVDIELGEALSVKSNQIAYLLNPNGYADNVLIKRKVKFLSNPMSYEQYTTMTKRSAWKSDLLNEELSILPKCYASYNADITPVFSNLNGGTVYLYLTFPDSASAAVYFNALSKSDCLTGQQLRTYAEQYINKLTINSGANVFVFSNFINQYGPMETYPITAYTRTNIQTIIPVAVTYINGLGYSASWTDVTVLASKARTKYLGEEDVDDDGKKYEYTFTKLINTTKLTEFVSRSNDADVDKNTDTTITSIDNGVIIMGTAAAKAILVDNKGKDAYVLEESGSGIIIASGDVILKEDWVGTVMSGGKIYNARDNSASIPVTLTYNANTIAQVLPLYFTESGSSMQVLNVFNGYEDWEVNEASKGDAYADMISECITFTNWENQ